MKVTVHNVIVARDAMTKISKQVWPWELPILESQFPGGAVQLTGTTFAELESLPDTEEEFVRLERMYGVEEGTKQSHISLAYERGARGFALLETAIANSLYTEGETAKAEKVKKTPKVKAEKSNVPVDPLS